MMKKAFTLAEVLITLGIIGVVAALTMPSLIANHKKKVYVTGLRKAVNTWNNGLKLMLVTDGVEYFNDTEFARTLLEEGYGYGTVDLKQYPKALSILNKYIKMTPLNKTVNNIKNLDGSNASGSDSSYVASGTTPDGAFYSFKLDWIHFSPSYLETTMYGGTRSSINGVIIVDVNGPKAPNIIGRDLFLIFIDVRGNIVFAGSQRDHELFGQSHYCDHGASWGCTGHIAEKGWVMDY
ncbi:MAG: type II secretion system GspH family protein [Heliobacteriaceae bacterium]|jgi:prepilin-type N-terminal cleavage/methylation domain-containing protein|nr:type II secretion system GspH family protein [Heliobacteriaceae bacterium]